MKHIVILFFGLSIAWGIAGQQPEGYTLIWCDEFDTDGLPDQDVWRYEEGFVRNQELQWYGKGNARCEGGLLKIEARKERVPNPDYQSGSSDWRKNREYAEYTSSCLHTNGTCSWQYGRFEIKARIPVACGSWPAIWTLGVTEEWPSNGEIDIMEFYRVAGVPYILANAAWGTSQQWTPQWDGAKVPLSQYTRKDPEWAKKFHIWRMDWDDKYIKLYMDDELINTVNLRLTTNPGGFNPFHQPHYLLLNLAIGGNGGDPSGTAFPLVYEIDYVRVYQKNTSNIQSRLPAGTVPVSVSGSGRSVKISLCGKAGLPVTAEVYGITGSCLARKSLLTDGSAGYDLGLNLPSGCYLVKVSAAGNESLHKLLLH